MRNFKPKNEGPELLKEVLSRLFTARGWGRRQGRLHLERAWETAVGPKHARQTRLAGIRKGIMEIEVNNGVLLQELSNFHKKKLLEEFRKQVPDTMVKDIKFRLGNW